MTARLFNKLNGHAPTTALVLEAESSWADETIQVRIMQIGGRNELQSLTGFEQWCTKYETEEADVNTRIATLTLSVRPSVRLSVCL